MAHILWRALDGTGFDRCSLETVGNGHRLSGTALLSIEDEAYEIRYSVITNAAHAPTTVGAHVQSSGNDRRMALQADGEGSWSVGDEPLLDLYGAIDVDLAWTPATNTLAIMRLGLAVGDSAEITAAFVDFPGHEIGRRNQRYTRLDDSTYRYESADFAAELTVGTSLLVTRYGEIWEAVAPTPTPE